MTGGGGGGHASRTAHLLSRHVLLLPPCHGDGRFGGTRRGRGASGTPTQTRRLGYYDGSSGKCLWSGPSALLLLAYVTIKSSLKCCSLEILMECLKFFEEMRRDKRERKSAQVAQQEPVTILTQRHQQKYYTDMYRATKRHMGILSGKGNNSPQQLYISLYFFVCVVGPILKAILFLLLQTGRQ